MKALSEDPRADWAPASPLFAQRGLNFAHSDQRAEVLHLSADLRHVQAAHVVEVLVRPGRLAVREEPPLERPSWPPDCDPTYRPLRDRCCGVSVLHFSTPVCSWFFTCSEIPATISTQADAEGYLKLLG